MTRTNNGPHLMKRKTSPYWYICWSENNQSKRVSAGTTDYGQALEALAVFRASHGDIGAVPRFRPPADERRRFVYFVQRGDNGPIKIGVSYDVIARVKTLQTGCAETLTLLRVAEAGAYAEAELHAKLRQHRLSGEWFMPHPDVLECIALLTGAELARYDPLARLGALQQSISGHDRPFVDSETSNNQGS